MYFGSLVIFISFHSTPTIATFYLLSRYQSDSEVKINFLSATNTLWF